MDSIKYLSKRVLRWRLHVIFVLGIVFVFCSSILGNAAEIDLLNEIDNDDFSFNSTKIAAASCLQDPCRTEKKALKEEQIKMRNVCTSLFISRIGARLCVANHIASGTARCVFAGLGAGGAAAITGPGAIPAFVIACGGATLPVLLSGSILCTASILNVSKKQKEKIALNDDLIVAYQAYRDCIAIQGS